MSASYPSSSGWEPYGSSQQAHALGWRRPATRPSPVFPGSSIPSSGARPSATPPVPSAAAARWNQQQKHLSARPTAPPAPPHTQQHSLAVSASFQQHERETRVVARYETLRTDVKAATARVQRLADDIAAGKKDAEDRDEQLTRDIAALHGVCSSLREDLREQRRDEEERRECEREERKRGDEEGRKNREDDLQAVERTVGRTLQKRLREIEDRVESRVVNAVQRLVKRSSNELSGVLRDAVMEIKKASPVPRDDEKRPHSPPAPALLAREARKAGRVRREIARPQTAESDDLYALQVASRPRASPAQDFSDPFFEAQGLINLSELQDGNNSQGPVQRDQGALASHPASSGANFFEEEQDEFLKSESTDGTLSKDPNFRRTGESSDSDSLKMHSFNTKSKRPRSSRGAKKGQSAKRISKKRDSHTAPKVRQNVGLSSAATPARITRSRVSIGTQRIRYPK